MPVRKDSRLLQRINQWLDSQMAAKKKSLESEASLDLGMGGQECRVSMESFFQFNFEISQDLKSLVEKNRPGKPQSVGCFFQGIELADGNRLAHDSDDAGQTSGFSRPRQPR